MRRFRTFIALVVVIVAMTALPAARPAAAQTSTTDHTTTSTPPPTTAPGTTTTTSPATGGDAPPASVPDDSITVPPREQPEGVAPEAGHVVSVNPRGARASVLARQAAYTEAVLRWVWSEAGGTLRGKVRAGGTPTDARPFYSAASEPLAVLVRDMNKFSNNVMARQLFLTIGGELAGPPARAEEAARVIRQWLAAKKIDAPEVVLENGSGLSRLERISAQHLGALLLAAWRSPVMPEFVSSLLWNGFWQLPARGSGTQTVKSPFLSRGSPSAPGNVPK